MTNLKDCTASKAGLTAKEQRRIMLQAIQSRGGFAQIQEIYADIDANMARLGCMLSKQGKLNISSKLSNLSNEWANYLFPYDPKSPGWRITPKGAAHLAAIAGADSSKSTEQLLADAAQELEKENFFDATEDERKRVVRTIAQRQGQPKFRMQLLKAYDGRCAISGCKVTEVLDAAHIIPYKGSKTNHPANGLVLRTDLHTLFDLNLIAIDSGTMTLLVSPRLDGSSYVDHRGKKISAPKDPKCSPSKQALNEHRKESGL